MAASLSVGSPGNSGWSSTDTTDSSAVTTRQAAARMRTGWDEGRGHRDPPWAGRMPVTLRGWTVDPASACGSPAGVIPVACRSQLRDRRGGRLRRLTVNRAGPCHASSHRRRARVDPRAGRRRSRSWCRCHRAREGSEELSVPVALVSCAHSRAPNPPVAATFVVLRVAGRVHGHASPRAVLGSVRADRGGALLGSSATAAPATACTAPSSVRARLLYFDLRVARAERAERDRLPLDGLPVAFGRSGCFVRSYEQSRHDEARARRGWNARVVSRRCRR